MSIGGRLCIHNTRLTILYEISGLLRMHAALYRRQTTYRLGTWETMIGLVGDYRQTIGDY